jgi:succinate-acetate transporter protein
MTHNGIDIDQFILLTLYPTAAFLITGLLSRKFALSEPLKYVAQALSCIIFAIVYIVTIPNGGAQGLATVLILFGGILFLMARKHIMHPNEGQENLLPSEKKQMDDRE